MPYGTVAHRNVPKQCADPYPTTAKPPTDIPCVRRRFGRFCVPVRAGKGKTQPFGRLSMQKKTARWAHDAIVLMNHVQKGV